MSEIPAGWKKTAVGELLRESRLAGSDGASAKKLTVKLYGLGVIPKNDSSQGSANTRYYKRRTGQFIYSKLDFLNGAFGLVPPNLDGYETTLDVPAFDFTSREICPEWFLAYVSRPSFYRAQTDLARGSRKARRVSPDSFLDLDIPLPPLDEQRRIAAILTAVDENLAQTKAIVDQLQIVKKGLMHALLTTGIPGRHTRFKQTEIGSIPADWEVVQLDELVDLSGGHGFRPEDWSSSGLPIIRIQNLNGSASFNFYSGAPNPAWIVEPGELLYAWAGSRGASFGPCIWPGPRGLLNQHIYRVAPKGRAEKRFLYLVLRQITSEIERRAHGFKQSLVHLKKSELIGWPVPLPSSEEQQLIVSRVDALETRLAAETERLKALEAVRASLASRLLTGKLRVRPDPTPDLAP